MKCDPRLGGCNVSTRLDIALEANEMTKALEYYKGRYAEETTKQVASLSKQPKITEMIGRKRRAVEVTPTPSETQEDPMNYKELYLALKEQFIEQQQTIKRLQDSVDELAKRLSSNGNPAPTNRSSTC